VKTPSSPAPASPDAEKPKLQFQYRGMQIFDARERVVIVIEGEQPCGLGAGLRAEGFRRRSRTTWEAPANPRNYMAAQVIGQTFFTSEQETP
jgi:hypothetical protein